MTNALPDCWFQQHVCLAALNDTELAWCWTVVKHACTIYIYCIAFLCFVLRQHSPKKGWKRVKICRNQRQLFKLKITNNQTNSKLNLKWDIIYIDQFSNMTKFYITVDRCGHDSWEHSYDESVNFFFFCIKEARINFIYHSSTLQASWIQQNWTACLNWKDHWTLKPGFSRPCSMGNWAGKLCLWPPRKTSPLSAVDPVVVDLPAPEQMKLQAAFSLEAWEKLSF